MNEIVDRAARAICISLGECDGSCLSCRNRKEAVAAIATMREPSEAMKLAGLEAAYGLVEPHEAPRESGVEVECSISETDAQSINNDMMEAWRGSYVAAIDAMLAECACHEETDYNRDPVNQPENMR